MTPDKWFLSYRFYIGVLSIVDVFLNAFFQIDFSPEDQASMAKQIQMIVEIAIPLGTGVLSLVSKIRESRKLKTVKEV